MKTSLILKGGLMKRLAFISFIILTNTFISCSTEKAVDNNYPHEDHETNLPCVGTPNPSACYCDQMGFPYVIEKESNGEAGYTILPNGAKVNAWIFYRGEVYPEYSYCARRGYQAVTDTVDHGSYTTVCAACVEYDNQHNIVMKMPMVDFMRLYGDTLCNGKPFFRNSSRIK